MSAHSRRKFLEYLRNSPLLLPAAGALVAQDPASKAIGSPDEALNVFDFMTAAQKKIMPQHWAYLMTGADDDLTVKANREGFQLFQIRPRRFVDVLQIDTSVEVFGQRHTSPVMVAPCGSHGAFHPDAEIATARGARDGSAQMILSTYASLSIRDVAKEYGRPLWFQLYPTNDFEVTRELIRRAEAVGAPVLVLTCDSPAGANRETQRRGWDKKQPQCRACHDTGVPNYLREHRTFDGIDLSRVRGHLYPITWDLVERVRRVTSMKIVMKGVVTGEDAELCVKNGVDGIIVSNHGGRQEETLLSTIEVLPEVIDAVSGKIPVLIDSGFRRGTDVFKALALGAKAICIGRPYLWGLGAFGSAGVQRVLELLKAELTVVMRMSGTPAVANITPRHVRRRPC
ncbi:MAG: alpha-hydroxy-acid oxidizing protein [Acidobacteria bacterium]|nr:alpha-hydroxy-acid oxidizing protein [Acidobacteriota bacterium]